MDQEERTTSTARFGDRDLRLPTFRVLHQRRGESSDSLGENRFRCPAIQRYAGPKGDRRPRTPIPPAVNARRRPTRGRGSGHVRRLHRDRRASPPALILAVREHYSTSLRVLVRDHDRWWFPHPGSAYCFRVPDFGNWCRCIPQCIGISGSLTHTHPTVRRPFIARSRCRVG